MESPTPHGVGGLKSKGFTNAFSTLSPTPHGVGGLKFDYRLNRLLRLRPTPHGVGGLKCSKKQKGKKLEVPLPTEWVD